MHFYMIAMSKPIKWVKMGALDFDNKGCPIEVEHENKA